MNFSKYKDFGANVVKLFIVILLSPLIIIKALQIGIYFIVRKILTFPEKTNHWHSIENQSKEELNNYKNVSFDELLKIKNNLDQYNGPFGYSLINEINHSDRGVIRIFIGDYFDEEKKDKIYIVVNSTLKYFSWSNENENELVLGFKKSKKGLIENFSSDDYEMWWD